MKFCINCKHASKKGGTYRCAHKEREHKRNMVTGEKEYVFNMCEFVRKHECGEDAKWFESQINKSFDDWCTMCEGPTKPDDKCKQCGCWTCPDCREDGICEGCQSRNFEQSNHVNVDIKREGA